MISLAIILILAWSFYIGYSRGLVLQAFYSMGSIIAMVVATATYKNWHPSFISGCHLPMPLRELQLLF